MFLMASARTSTPKRPSLTQLPHFCVAATERALPPRSYNGFINHARHQIPKGESSLEF